MAKWQTSWELSLPAGNAEELLLALVVKDLLHGASYDVELAERPDVALAVDFVAGDELEGEAYTLIIDADIDGPQEPATLQELAEEIVEELVDEAEGLIAERELVEALPMSEVRFVAVAEEAERWDLIVPDWLAPDSAEVPFGFRPELVASGEAWPSNEVLDRYGRVVVVPYEGELRLVAIPAPSSEHGDSEAEAEAKPAPKI